MPKYRILDVLLWGVLAVVLIGVFAAWGWSTWTGAAESDGAAAPLFPDFAFTERSGKTVTRGDLLGQPWVADFIFTSCAGPCPVMSARMSELQKEFADRRVRFVSFTLDPRRDTPAVLSEYADRFQADPNQWLFLTGDEAAIHTLAQEGLHLAARRATDDERQQGADRIIHSTRFVLVDARGRVRGSFVGTDENDVARLRNELDGLCPK